MCFLSKVYRIFLKVCCNYVIITTLCAIFFAIKTHNPTSYLFVITVTSEVSLSVNWSHLFMYAAGAANYTAMHEVPALPETFPFPAGSLYPFMIVKVCHHRSHESNYCHFLI